MADGVGVDPRSKDISVPQAAKTTNIADRATPRRNNLLEFMRPMPTSVVDGLNPISEVSVISKDGGRPREVPGSALRSSKVG